MRSDFDKEFNKDFSRMSRLAIGGVALTFTMYAATLGFFGWVVVKVLQHLGIV